MKIVTTDLSFSILISEMFSQFLNETVLKSKKSQNNLFNEITFKNNFKNSANFTGKHRKTMFTGSHDQLCSNVELSKDYS